MKENFEASLAVTLKWEGGYSNNSDDPGGPTDRGITQANYNTARKRWGLGVQDVRKMTDAEMRRIYREEYWNELGCDDLPLGLDCCVFDAGVNSGVSRAKGWLSRSRDIDGFCDLRVAFLKQTGRLWRVFGLGWSRRVASIRQTAKTMAGKPSQKGTTMVTATTTTTIATPAAPVTKTSFWSSIVGALTGSSLVGYAISVFSWLEPGKSAILVAAIMALGGLVTAVASIFHLLHLTFPPAIETTLNTALEDLGSTPKDFDGDGTVNPVTPPATPIPTGD